MKRRRTYRWTGHVTDLDESSLWIALTPVDHEGPELEAEFDRKLLPAAGLGSFVTLYVHRRGRKVRSVLRERVLPPLTAEELDRARQQARVWAEELKWVAE